MAEREALSSALQNALVSRQISAGLELAREARRALVEDSCSDSFAAELTSQLSRWIDMDFSLLPFVRGLLQDRFARRRRNSSRHWCRMPPQSCRSKRC